ncbi:MAG: sugB 2 [Dehalococcoidia bacterium]|nr:sugB 2 [Dehalococcoidia bacterium]
MIPVFFLLWDSFKDVQVGNLLDLSLNNFTLKNFRVAFADPRTPAMIGNSLIFAFGAMAVAFVFGGVIAFLVERTNTPFRNFIYGLMYIPLVMPSMLKAIAWILLLSPTIGWFNKVWFLFGFTQPLFNAYSVPAMFWVEGLSMAPLTFLLLGAALRAMDPSLEEAAFTAGASKPVTLYRITFRLMTPALAGIALLQFIRGLEAFEVPLMMGAGQGLMVFSTNIYMSMREMFPPAYGEAFVSSLALIALSVIGLVLYQRAMSGAERYATITGKGYRPRLMDLGRWRRAAGAFILFFLLVAVILPFFVLLWASFLPYYQLPSAEALSLFTWKNYRFLLSRPEFLLTLKNTAILGVIVAGGGMLLATLISWMVVRLKVKGARLLDALVFIPYALPGIAIGFSYMIFFLMFPNPIYGTIWILVLVYLVRFLPMGTRFTHAGLAQIKAELEEAASTSGAGLFTIMRRIIIPLMLPSLIAGALYLLILSMKVLSMAAVLYTAQSLILPVLLFTLWRDGSIPLTGALSVLMVLVLSGLTILSRKLAQRRGMVAEA